jgi:hypothetical protein
MRNTLPESVQQEMQKIETQDKEEENDLTVPNETILGNLKEIVGESDTQKFLKFAQDLEAGSIELSTQLDLDSDFSDKAKRTEFHMFFKRHLKKYESDTVSIGDDIRRVRVFLKSGLSKHKRQKLNINNNWGFNKFAGSTNVKMPEYLSVAMQKTNYESVQALHFISKRTKKQIKQFGIAGNKDKRGITT